MKQKKQSFASVKSKRELLNLQRNFADIIRRPLNSKDAMLPDGRSDQMVSPSPTLRPHERLELYAQQYWWRIEDSFDEDFTSVRAFMTREGYLRLRDAYLKACPSESYTLRNLGKKFPAFLKKYKAFTKPHTNLLFDCACFDWARIEAFDARELRPLAQQDLADPNFVRTILKTQPHIRLLALSYPVDKAVRQGAIRNAEEASNTGLKKRSQVKTKRRSFLLPEKVFLAVHRHNGRIFIKRLSQDEFSLLQKLEKGSTLSALMRAIVASKSLSADALQHAFHEWTTLGWLYVDKKSV